MKLKNWKTTAAAIVTLLTVAAHTFGYIDTATMERLVGVAAGLGLWAAKDHNVSGGTKQQ